MDAASGFPRFQGFPELFIIGAFGGLLSFIPKEIAAISKLNKALCFMNEFYRRLETALKVQ